MNEKYEIEIPGLPEGWKPIAYRPVKEGEHRFDYYGAVSKAASDSGASYLVVEKIKPKRIILEATGEVRRPEAGEYVRTKEGTFCLRKNPGGWVGEYEIWREVKEEA